MAQATTTYLNIEATGADKLILAMGKLQQSLSNASAGIWQLNRGLGIVAGNSSKTAQANQAQAQAASQAATQTQLLRSAMLQQTMAAQQLQTMTSSLAAGMQAQAQATAQNKTTWSELNSKIQAVTGTARAAYAVIQKGVAVYQDLTAAAYKQEQAQNTLARSLLASGIKGGIADLQAWASALQDTTTSGDEATLQLAAQAAAFSKDKTQIKSAVEATLDFAAATGGNASQALKTIGAAMTGRLDGLKSLGIYLDENEQKQLKELDGNQRLEKIVSLLKDRYAGFAEELAKTPTGKAQQLANSFGDIKEKLGQIASSNFFEITTRAGDKLGLIEASLKGWNQLLDKIIAKQNSGLVYDASGDIYSKSIKPLKQAEAQAEKTAKAIALAQSGGDTATAKTGRPAAKKADPAADLAKTLATIAAQERAAQAATEWIADGATAAAYLAEQQKKFADQRLQAEINFYQTTGRLEDAAALQAVKYDQEAQERARKAQAEAEAREAERAQKEAQRQAETLTAAQLYEQKIVEIKTQAAAQLKALDDLTQSSPAAAAWASQQRLAIEAAEQAQLYDLKVSYAQQTKDALGLITLQYQAAEQAAATQAAQAWAEQVGKIKESASQNLQGLGDLGLQVMGSLIDGTGDWRSALYDGFKSLSTNLIKTGLQNIISLAFQNQAAAMQSQMAIPYVGPILAVAAGAAALASTMALKSKLKPAQVSYANGGYISAGILKGGAYGRDSVTAALMPGERVLSKREAEAYDRDQTGGNTYNFTINITGSLATPAQVQQTVRQTLIPELRRAIDQGYVLTKARQKPGLVGA